MATTVYLAPTFGVGYQCFTTGGLVNNGGYIDTFQAGTTTVTSVYTTSLGTVAHANPIVLGSDGRLPAGGEMWFLGGVAMKLVIKDSTSSAIQTQDNLYGVNDPTSINNIGPSGATVSAAINMVGAAINETQGASIAIAGSVNLTTATGNYLAFTGSGTVTSITLSPAGVYREAVITNTCAFTNNANILMLGNTSVTANPGDIIGFRGEASGVVRNVLYERVSGVNILGTQAANTVLAGPTTSPAAVPTFRGLVQADLGLASSISSLSADFLLGTSATFVDGQSVSVGPIGTWYVSANTTMTDTSLSAGFNTKLWDGVSVIASTAGVIAGAGQALTLTLSGVITSPAGPLRVSIRDQSSQAGKLLFNVTGAGKDCTIVAVRIA